MDIINIPLKVECIMKQLEDNGYECYVVGGAIRDAVLGYKPKDWDLATNATPNDVVKLFPKTLPTGEKFGTITVVTDGDMFEVTTYRLEADYDGRRPNVVSFSDNLLDDLKRRDFTINSMALNRHGYLIDPFGGLEDLNNKVLRCVGDAKERINEDKLRALRAVRFSNKYNFNIDRELNDALSKVDISGLSVERVREEFNKILFSDTPVRGVMQLHKYKLFKKIFSELAEVEINPYTFTKSLKILNLVRNDRIMRLSALFVSLGLYSTEINIYAMKRLKYSNKEILSVEKLVSKIEESLKTVDELKPFISKVGVELIDDLFHLKLAYLVSKDAKIEEIEETFSEKLQIMEIIKSKCPLNICDININGADIIELGYTGVKVGELLQMLLEHVWAFPEDNYKEKLLFIIRMKG